MKKITTILLILIASFSKAQDGVLDSTFGTGGQINFANFTTITDMKIDNNKIIVVGGNAGNIQVARFNLDGSLDTTFDTDGLKTIILGTNTDYVSSLAIDSNHNIFLASYFYSQVMKLHSDGSFDTTFATAGTLTYESSDYIKNAKIAIDQSNKLLITGYNYNIDRCPIYKFNADGSLDTTFNSAGSGNPINVYLPYSIGYTGYSTNGIFVDSSNNIIVTAPKNVAGGNDLYSMRYSSLGVTDYSYTSGGGFSSSGRSPIYPVNFLDDSNNLYTVGNNGNYFYLIDKVTATGNKDTTFGTSGIFTYDFTATTYDYANYMCKFTNASGSI